MVVVSVCMFLVFRSENSYKLLLSEQMENERKYFIRDKSKTNWQIPYLHFYTSVSLVMAPQCCIISMCTLILYKQFIEFKGMSQMCVCVCVLFHIRNHINVLMLFTLCFRYSDKIETVNIIFGL